MDCAGLAALLAARPATAQESGFTWTVMRYAYVLDDKGLSTGTFEIERQAR